MVVITADIARDADELAQVEMSARIGRRAESVPRRASVAADVAAFDSLLEQRERVTEYRAEPCRLDGVELLLGVVEIVHVDRAHAEVCLTRLDLMRDERRRQRVAATNDILGCHDAWIDECALQVREIVVACARRRRHRAGCSRLLCK